MPSAMAVSVYYAVYDGYRPVPINFDDVIAFECGSREAHVSICRDIATQLDITVDASKFNRLDILHYSDLELFAAEEAEDSPDMPWPDWPKLPDWPTYDKPTGPETTPAPVYEASAPSITPAPAPRPRPKPKGQMRIPGTSARAMVKRTLFK